MDDWKTILSFWGDFGLFSGAFALSFREVNSAGSQLAGFFVGVFEDFDLLAIRDLCLAGLQVGKIQQIFRPWFDKWAICKNGRTLPTCDA